MNKPQALSSLLRDMQADVHDYHRLRMLLEEQFNAALGHDSERTEVLGRDITSTVDVLDMRRQARVQLVRQLLPKHPQPGMDTLFQSLPTAARDATRLRWQTLEALVRECKAINVRNGYLMTQQQAMLNQVLSNEEAHTYAAV